MRIGRQKSIMDRAHDYVGSVADTVIPQLEAALETARDKAGPVLADARDKAAPVLADARDRAVPLLHDAHEKAGPILTEGRARASEKAAAGAALAAGSAVASRDFAAAKVAELRGQPVEPEGSKLKKALLFGGLLALGGALFAKLRKKSSGTDNWQSSYKPTPPPAPRPATPAAPASPVSSVSPADARVAAPVTGSAPTGGAQGDPLTDPLTSIDEDTPTGNDAADAAESTGSTESTDDVGGGAPGEAISDAAVTPHEVTTPDSPAEIIDVDDVPKPKNS